MKPILQDVFSYGIDNLLNPDRFREVLVIVLTGVGEHPGDIVRMLGAWIIAVLIAEKIYPGRK